MDKVLLKKLILEYQQYVKEIKLQKRDIDICYQNNYVFVGLRRAGKSYLMYQCIQYLLEDGCDERAILYMNFEDERLIDFDIHDFDLLKLAFEELYECKPVFFLDEIQIVEGWEKFVRRLADTGYHVFVTGSNAKMLSSEIATTLGGRFSILEVYPFSFSEYLTFNNIKLDENWELKNTSDIVRSFDVFFRMGGLPEVLNIEEKFKRQWLSGLYNKIYFGDLLSRYSIRNDRAIKLLIHKLAESVKQPLSYNRLANIISSITGKIKSDTIADYLSFLEESWLIFSIENYEARFVERATNKKYYFIDNGILNLFLMDPNTALLENLVALYLRKKYKDELFFYNSNVEVDFLVQESKIAYQVAFSIHDDDTCNREVKTLLKLNNYIKLERMIIVTMNDECVIRESGCEIEVLPIWKLLLL